MHETQSTNYPRLNGTHHLIKRVFICLLFVNDFISFI
jgi:hypothetical protein